MRLRTLTLIAPLACALALSACGKPKPAANSLDAMDNELVDGAITDNALAPGTIRVDPAKACKSGDCRAATTSLAEAAQRQAAHKSALPAGEAPTSGLESLDYKKDWATKLPADLPMMAGATLGEAAGHDAPFPVRIVSFSAPGDRAAVLAWYMGKAKAAGYSATRSDKGGDAYLEGEKPDGSSYAIIVGATAGGRTPVDYVWTHDG